MRSFNAILMFRIIFSSREYCPEFKSKMETREGGCHSGEPIHPQNTPLDASTATGTVLSFPVGNLIDIIALVLSH